MVVCSINTFLGNHRLDGLDPSAGFRTGHVGLPVATETWGYPRTYQGPSQHKLVCLAFHEANEYVKLITTNISRLRLNVSYIMTR